MSYYELWDIGSNNYVEDTETLEAALAAVRELIEADEYFEENLGLSFNEESDNGFLVAKGQGLAHLARKNLVTAA